MEVSYEVHEPLSIYGHQVDYLSSCTVLTGKIAQSERLEEMNKNKVQQNSTISMSFILTRLKKGC